MNEPVLKKKRWKVFLICTVLMFLFALIISLRGMSIWGWNFKTVWEVTFFTCLGPYSGIFMLETGLNYPEFWYLGLPTTGIIFLHPAKPTNITGVVTVIGFILWFFMGLAIVYSGV